MNDAQLNIEYCWLVDIYNGILLIQSCVIPSQMKFYVQSQMHADMYVYI